MAPEEDKDWLYFYRLLNRSLHPSTIWNTLKLALHLLHPHPLINGHRSFNSDLTTITNLLNSHFASVSSNTTPPPPDQTPVLSLSTPCTPHLVQLYQHGLQQDHLSSKSASSTILVSSPVFFAPISQVLHPSLFDYCDIVWSGCTEQEAHHLKTLFNFGCHPVLRRRRQYSASAARRELGLPTLASRRKLHLATMMFKCLSLHSPTYLSQIFSFPTSHYHTQSASILQINLPPVRTSFGQKSFSYVGSALWRSLPSHIHETKDFKTFSHYWRTIFSY